MLTDRWRDRSHGEHGVAVCAGYVAALASDADHVRVVHVVVVVAVSVGAGASLSAG